jgi:hypothetical protein
MLQTMREANKIINNFRDEREVIFKRSILAQRFSRIVVAQWYNEDCCLLGCSTV